MSLSNLDELRIALRAARVALEQARDALASGRSSLALRIITVGEEAARGALKASMQRTLSEPDR